MTQRGTTSLDGALNRIHEDLVFQGLGEELVSRLPHPKRGIQRIDESRFAERLEQTLDRSVR